MQPQKTWRERFDEEFALPNVPEGGINLIIKQIREGDRAEIKSFIETTIAEERKRTLEQVRKALLEADRNHGKNSFTGEHDDVEMAGVTFNAVFERALKELN